MKGKAEHKRRRVTKTFLELGMGEKVPVVTIDIYTLSVLDTYSDYYSYIFNFIGVPIAFEFYAHCYIRV